MIKSLLTASAAILLAGASAAPAIAQEDTTTAPAGETDSSQYVGKSVFDANGQEVGVIEGIKTADDGSEKAILSVGGFLGLGAKKVTVATTDLQANADGSGYTVAMTADELEAAPAYEKDKSMETEETESEPY